MPMCQPAPMAAMNTSRCEAKNSVTIVTRRSGLTRDANAPYAGTRTSSSIACAADE
ncbi:hypothetical protein D3C83_254530 [compost metagenome]